MPPEKIDMETFEWPRILLQLSRKEKEDDFLIMKGTKLSQRPKKWSKYVEKVLQVGKTVDTCCQFIVILFSVCTQAWKEGEFASDMFFVSVTIELLSWKSQI